ncbi:hypothetical protein niasHT_039668 [Heterodera trifolii]|uniref:Uncharacterized protein n=1 Tax=Heterodera trifolii TaxID=157864 RepID=A0ABD2ICA1_9BILA
MASLSFCANWPKNTVPLETYVDESLHLHCKLCNKIANSASDGAKWLQKSEEGYVSLLKFCIDELRNSDKHGQISPAGEGHHQFLFACHGFTADKRKLSETIGAIAKKEAQFCKEQKYCQMF